ncbi:hypothetical protein, partial [Oceanidesulfovibrio marinus]|uniref:hypothetical protein n=1 Tax=Oceanidesulfovibrio marinus TaxID=370038 RepID=UPI001F3126D3
VLTAVVRERKEALGHPVQEVSVALVEGPGHRLVGEGLIQYDEAAGIALLGDEDHALRQVVDKRL